MSDDSLPLVARVNGGRFPIGANFRPSSGRTGVIRSLTYQTFIYLLCSQSLLLIEGELVQASARLSF